jgi:hypothetical protein
MNPESPIHADGEDSEKTRRAESEHADLVSRARWMLPISLIFSPIGMGLGIAFAGDSSGDVAAGIVAFVAGFLMLENLAILFWMFSPSPNLLTENQVRRRRHAFNVALASLLLIVTITLAFSLVEVLRMDYGS